LTDRQIGLVGVADAVAFVTLEVLVDVEQADQPVDAVGGSRQAVFGAQGLECGQRLVPLRVAVQDVSGSEVEVQAVDGIPRAPCGNRGQRGIAEPAGVPVGLQRDALVLDVLLGAAVAVSHPREGIARGRERGAARGDALPGRQRADDLRGRAQRRLHGRAAVLFATGEVGDDVDVPVVVGLEQQLASHGVEVLVVVLGFGARACAGAHVHEAVALALGGVDAESGVVAQGVVVGRGNAERTVVADGDLALDALAVARAPGDDVDDARRGVLAEQGALRALQHLDALDLAEVAKADAVARAVDAVDDHADRGFQAGVVAHGTDAADARGGLRLALGAGHGQAGHQGLQVLDVAHAGVLQDLLIERGDRDRDVLQRLLALLRRDHDRGEGGRLVAFRFGRRLLRQRAGRKGHRRERRAQGEGERVALRVCVSHGCPLPNG
jgi:hypothetical protein